MKWRDLRSNETCPICGHKGWCAVSDSGAVYCHRKPSDHPAKSGEGWLHFPHPRTQGVTECDSAVRVFAGVGRSQFRNSLIADAKASCVQKPPQFSISRSFACLPIDDAKLEGLAGGLGVSLASLQVLDVRWDALAQAWAFPMRDAMSDIVGIRYRGVDGGKWSARGTKDGLFMPVEWLENPEVKVKGEGQQRGELFICEGASDTAAALTLGLHAIGRSSCTSGTALLQAYIRLNHVKKVTIIADNDAPGSNGAKSLRSSLITHTSSLTRIVYPPPGVKDLRAFLISQLPTSYYLLPTIYYSRVRARFDLLCSAIPFQL